MEKYNKKICYTIKQISNWTSFTLCFFLAATTAQDVMKSLCLFICMLVCVTLFFCTVQCLTCTLQHVYFETPALCNTCTMQHEHFATHALCITWTMKHMQFAACKIAICAICNTCSLCKDYWIWIQSRNKTIINVSCELLFILSQFLNKNLSLSLSNMQFITFATCNLYNLQHAKFAIWSRTP